MGKKILIYIAGVFTGAALMFLIALTLSKGNSEDQKNNFVIFETEGECVSDNSFEVFQVLDSGDALAKEIKAGLPYATGVTVLFHNDGTQTYYDEQRIKIPSGKCVKQIGIYKYPTKMGVEKTVPIVGILDK